MNKPPEYYIQNIYNPTWYWCNMFGWIDLEDCNFEEYPIFISYDMQEDLPMEGRWVSVFEVTKIVEE